MNPITSAGMTAQQASLQMRELERKAKVDPAASSNFEMTNKDFNGQGGKQPIHSEKQEQTKQDSPTSMLFQQAAFDARLSAKEEIIQAGNTNQDQKTDSIAALFQQNAGLTPPQNLQQPFAQTNSIASETNLQEAVKKIVDLTGAKIDGLAAGKMGLREAIQANGFHLKLSDGAHGLNAVNVNFANGGIDVALVGSASLNANQVNAAIAALSTNLQARYTNRQVSVVVQNFAMSSTETSNGRQEEDIAGPNAFGSLFEGGDA